MNNEIINKVNELFEGKVYLVGGSVRDILLGKEPNDLDFTTPLNPEEIEAVLKKNKMRAYGIGKRFGTIGCKIDGNYIEITTFRNEKYIKGSRKPEVEFVSDLSSDLSRRDFTINSMAQSSDGKIIDQFEGRKDLEEGLIRAVGHATTRFKEDPLRMLRACRFASQLGFQIEKVTLDRMTKYSYKILEVSKERWTMELDKLLMGDNVATGLNYLWESGLMKYMIPELYIQYGFDQRTKHHNFPLHIHTSLVVFNCPKDLTLRWAALLHDVGKPFIYQDKGDRWIYPHHEVLGAEFVDKIAKYLKWSKKRRLEVTELVLHHLEDESPLRKYDNMSKKNEK